MSIVTPAEVLVRVDDLRLGDVVTRVPGTDIPVRWRMGSDPTTCDHGHMAILAALDGEYGQPRTLLFFVGDLVSIDRAPAVAR